MVKFEEKIQLKNPVMLQQGKKYVQLKLQPQ